MTLPNFLIIGAPKAGTTALYQYLKQHPQIYMSSVKETNFFASESEQLDFRGPADQDERKNVTDIEVYQALFRGVSNEKAIGEASPLYLSSSTAPERIQHHIPKAKLIAILRNPVDRAYSDYLMQVRGGWESFTDFSQLPSAAEMLKHSNVKMGRNLIRGGFYYTQLKRYFDLFGRDQIKVYLYEDLSINPLGVLQNIFRFLAVDETFVPDMSTKHNVSGVPKNKLLHHVLLIGLKPIKKVLKLPPLAGLYINLRDRYFQHNLVKPQLALEVRQQLIEVYRDDILKLQDLIQRDLSKWLK